MTYTERKRMHTFQVRHGIKQGFNIQAFAIATLLIITPVVVSDYFSARGEESRAKAAYYESQ